MSTPENSSSELSTQRLPVYMTRQSAARLTGVHDYTFGKYAVPDAWRRERDGRLSPLYSEAAVEAFKVTYTVEKSDGGEL